MTIIRFDECISHRIVDALRALSLPAGVSLESAQHQDEVGVADVDWITTFAARGGAAFVSGDANMRNVPLERAALEASGLIAFFPASKGWFEKLGKYGQAAYLMRWFPQVMDLTKRAEPRTHFRLPASFSADPVSIEVLKPLAEIEAAIEAKARARGLESSQRNASQPEPPVEDAF
ncbi:MAG: hypothetical protein JWM33_2456 [Caulobacteraceae bacterium]|nr:hypothetical protein [Caulobacteraceae bacterium]